MCLKYGDFIALKKVRLLWGFIFYSRLIVFLSYNFIGETNQINVIFQSAFNVDLTREQENC